MKGRERRYGFGGFLADLVGGGIVLAVVVVTILWMGYGGGAPPYAPVVIAGFVGLSVGLSLATRIPASPWLRTATYAGAVTVWVVVVSAIA